MLLTPLEEQYLQDKKSLELTELHLAETQTREKDLQDDHSRLVAEINAEIDEEL